MTQNDNKTSSSGAVRKEDKSDERPRSMVESLYNRVTILIEYYIFFCFLAITIIPLLEGDWVQPFVRFAYYTGFPSLILLLIVSLIKEPFLDMLKNRFEEKKPATSTGGKRKNG